MSSDVAAELDDYNGGNDEDDKPDNDLKMSGNENESGRKSD